MDKEQDKKTAFAEATSNLGNDEAQSDTSKVETVDPEKKATVAAGVEGSPESTEESPAESVPSAPESASTVGAVKRSGKKIWLYVVAVVVVAGILLGVLYLLEQQGRSSTQVFSSLIEKQEAKTVVATVNQTRITKGELEDSVEQFSQVAASQGMDPADPTTLAMIEQQALDVLINRELLQQAADETGIEVSEDDVTERFTEIEADLGAETLQERMAEMGVDEAQLRVDIREELLIDRLLESVLETGEAASDEAVAEFYEQAGGAEAGLPPLEEVRGQIEEQLVMMQEQEQIETYLSDLREGADITIVE